MTTSVTSLIGTQAKRRNANRHSFLPFTFFFRREVKREVFCPQNPLFLYGCLVSILHGRLPVTPILQLGCYKLQGIIQCVLIALALLPLLTLS